MAERIDPTTDPRLAVVTVSYGSEDVLGPFLSSIPAASSAAVAIAIADNLPGSGGAVERLAAERRANYLPMSANLGYGSAMNAGVRALPGSVDWILLSNPDVLLSPGAIDALVAVGGRDDSIASVGPAILNSDGTLYPSARAVPSLRTGIGHAMFSNLWPGNPWT
ncbi:MAG: glycosyltransferase, partial [Terrimesophilobacter sp.]